MNLSQSKRNKICLSIFTTLLLMAAGLSLATYLSIKPIQKNFHDIVSDTHEMRITDRHGVPLNISYQNQWNNFDYVAIYDVPEFLKTAFIYSEDKDFYHHQGLNWPARISALWQNIRHREVVRGASTITEQVVRTITPRPRTLWSRWLEGFESSTLEKSVTKQDIFEFYLNQIPYAANRRGVVQAARYYFNRDLNTLSPKEMLALVVLVRSPSGYDLYSSPDTIEKPLQRLASSMQKDGLITAGDYKSITTDKLRLEKFTLPTEARHFARFARMTTTQSDFLKTTLDSELQKQIQSIIDNRLKSLNPRHVANAGALVADYQTGEILAWVVGGATDTTAPANEIDAVTTPRQPGSALKPFLYASALDKGWTGATLINDSPLAEAVGHGLHRFKNYSNVNYGLITLREALGNSLNIPALLTISHVGAGDYLSTLQTLGFKSLSLNSDVYDEGLALGNGEVTLLEMVTGYAALANRGEYRPLHIFQQNNNPARPVHVYSEESTSIIGNILSDSKARRLEFGSGSVLNFPLQTAAKTGTSTDYRDAWTLAYNDRYVVGIWMGNLDRSPMNHVTGASGSALAMRSIFSLLNENRKAKPLYLSPHLVAHEVCIRPPKPDRTCPKRSEWFMANNQPTTATPSNDNPAKIELVRPTDGLQIAYDPRIPKEHQHFRFEIKGVPDKNIIQWTLDEQVVGEGISPTMLWPVQKGKHILSVTISDGDKVIHTLQPVTFLVK